MAKKVMTKKEFAHWKANLLILAQHKIEKFALAPHVIPGAGEFFRDLEMLQKKSFTKYPRVKRLVGDQLEDLKRSCWLYIDPSFRRKKKPSRGRPGADVGMARVVLHGLVRARGDSETILKMHCFLKPMGDLEKWWSKRTHYSFEEFGLPKINRDPKENENWAQVLKDQFWEIVYRADGGKPGHGAKSIEEKAVKKNFFDKLRSTRIFLPDAFLPKPKLTKQRSSASPH